MRRPIIAFVGALITWVLAASLLDRLLRIALPGYAAAEPQMDFTLAMQCSRLAEGALASLSAGWVAARVAPNARRLPLILGGVIFAAFLPVHYQLWDKFPVLYHAVFLLSIVPLVAAGAQMGAPKPLLAEIRS